MRRIIALLLTLTVFPALVNAAEVKNVKLSQSGDKAIATYDLVGGQGEKDAEVTVAITIGSETRTSDKLTLTGDFGKGIKVGEGKKIVWKALKDLPLNFDGELRWDIKASTPTATLEATLTFIREKLLEKTEFNYIAFVHNTVNNSDFTNTFKEKISDISTDPQNCLLNYHLNVVREGQIINNNLTAGIPFREVVRTEVITKAQSISKANADSGYPELIAVQTNPELFVLRVIRRGGGENDFLFEDFETGARVAKAVNHAMELCGGGDKGAPF